MKRIGLALTVILIFSLLAVNCAEKTDQIRMATGGSTATYYVFGSAAGRVLSEKTGIPITIQSTGASKANIELVAEEEVELAIAQNDIMDYAWKGTDLFNGEKVTGFSTMAALYPEVCHIVANPAAGIRSIEDLRGRNVSVGDSGSGLELNARQILEVYGISFNDIVKLNLNYGASADALLDERIDAFFFVAGAPTPVIMDLADNMDIALLEVDEAHAARLALSYPFYTPLSIPGGTYKGQSTAVKAVTVKAAFIVSSKLSNDTVYRLTKNLFESKAEIEAAHARGSDLSPAYAVEGVSVPFHPGAVKYYKEIGVMK